MRISELIIRFIDWFYRRPVAAILPRQTFRYIVCGGANVVFSWVCYFLVYNFVLDKEQLDLGFVVVSAYVATMLPVVQGIAALMNGGAGVAPYVFYFGLLSGATLGGNLTPIGASANITAIGILRKNGEKVTTRDFLRIGVPFTLAAVITGYVFIWIFWRV